MGYIIKVTHYLIMKRRIIQTAIMIMFMTAVFSIALTTRKNTTVDKENIEKVADIIIEPTPEVKDEKEIEKERTVSNLVSIQSRLDIINQKYKILKDLIPDDYTELQSLESQINNLNDSILSNVNGISNESDISQQTIDNLATISNSLNRLIEVFGDVEDSKQITGIISNIDNNTLYITSNETEYIVSISDNTVLDGDYNIGTNAIFICDNVITNDANNCIFLINLD